MYTVWTYLLENHGSLQSDLAGYENQMLAQRLNCKSKFIKKQYTSAFVTNNIFIHSRQIFFLFIGREPTTWHANNGLLMRNVVQLCLAEKIFCTKPSFSPSCDRSFLWKWQIASLLSGHPLKIKLGDRMIKQLLNYGYHKISWFVNVSQITIFSSTSSNNC